MHLATSGLLLQQVFWSRLRIVEHTSWWSRFFPLSVQALSHSLKIEDRNFEVCQPSTLIAMQSLTDNMCVRTMQCTPFQPAVSCMPQIIQTKPFEFYIHAMPQVLFIAPPRVEDVFDSTSPQMVAFLGCLGRRHTVYARVYAYARVYVAIMIL